MGNIKVGVYTPKVYKVVHTEVSKTTLHLLFLKLILPLRVPEVSGFAGWQ